MNMEDALKVMYKVLYIWRMEGTIPYCTSEKGSLISPAVETNQSEPPSPEGTKKKRLFSLTTSPRI